MYYNSFRNIVKILINKYEYQSYRQEIKNLIDKKDHITYYDKLELIINSLKNLCEKHVDFSQYSDEVLNKINNISFCFNDCKKEFCLQREDGECRFVIPEKNLISEKSNVDIYYARVADELLRHYRLRAYILEPNSYISFSKLIYNISENEIILPQSLITKEYFDSFKNKNIIDLNEFVKSNTYDNSSIMHNKLQKYSNKVKESDMEDVSLKIEQDEQNKPKGVELKIVDKLPIEKCYNLHDIQSKKLREKFLKGLKEREYFRKMSCNYTLFKDMYKEVYKKVISTGEIKNTLLDLYKSQYMMKYKNEIHDIMKNEGHNVEKIKEDINAYILSSKHFLTMIDLMILSKHFKIGVLNINDIKSNKISLIKNGDFDEYFLLKVNSQAMKHHGNNQLMPKFSLIVNEKYGYLSLSEIETIVNNNDCLILYTELEKYILSDK